MNTTREQKLKNCIKNNLNLHDAMIKSRRSNSKNEKGNPSRTLSYSNKILNKTLKINYKSICQKIRLTLNKNLQKHNSDLKKFYIKLINDIIYDEKKRIVCIFKDFLIWDESSDFLKRFYFNYESNTRIPKISQYYEKYSVMKPIYFKLTCNKIMAKNIKKQKKYLEICEENEDKILNQEDNKKIEILSEESKLLNSSLIEDKNILEEEKRVKVHLKFDNSNIINIENKENSYSVILNEPLNLSNDLSLYSQCDKLVFNNETKIPKIANSKINHLVTNTNQNKEKEKVTLLLPIKNNLGPIKSNNETKVLKKIEFNKLDLKNINKNVQFNNDENIESNRTKNEDNLNSIFSDIKFKSQTARNNSKPKTSRSPIMSNTIHNTPKNNTLNKRIITGGIKDKMKTLPDNAKSTLNNFQSKDHFNTNDIKKKFNLVENAVKHLKNIQNKNSVEKNNYVENKVKTNFMSKNISKEKKENLLTNINYNKTLSKNLSNKMTISTNKNSVIKLNTVKNILNENTQKIMKKYLSNNHSKQNSQNDFSNKINILKSAAHNKISPEVKNLKEAKEVKEVKKINNNNLPSSVYNINLNLNLNVNLNMMTKKTPSTAKNHLIENLNNPHLTEKTSSHYSNTLMSVNSKLEKTEKNLQVEKNLMSNIKANEKYKKISRNINVKNFILNYGSGNNTNLQNNLQNDHNNFTTPSVTINNRLKPKSLLINRNEKETTTKINNKNCNKNNLQFYSKKFVNSNTIMNTENSSSSSQKTTPFAKKLCLNLNGITRISSPTKDYTPNNNTFNQKSINQNIQQKQISINLKKNQYDSLKEILTSKYSLTSRNEKDSIKIFNNNF